jgi:hypothetical protein
MKEEEEMNVKTEWEICSEEGECVDIKDEDCIHVYSEEEKTDEALDTQEEEDGGMKEEVSREDTL